MEAPDQNKIVGRELAVAKAAYEEFEVNGKKKTGIILKQQLTVDPVTLEIHGVTTDALMDCVEQLEKMGTYEDLSKEQGYDNGGYKPTGLVIPSKVDPRVKMSVEFGHRWDKDSDAQQIKIVDKPLTLKWFMDVDNQDKEMGMGAVPEREVTPEELDIISKLREKENKSEAKDRPIMPVMEAVKSHKEYLSEAIPKYTWVVYASKDGKEVMQGTAMNPDDAVEKMKKHMKPGYFADLIQGGYHTGHVIQSYVHDQDDGIQQEDSAEMDDTPGMDYERDVMAPAWQKWTAKGGKPKYLGKVDLHDEFGDESGHIAIYQATHADHGNLPGKHILDPDLGELERAIDDAAADGFGEVIVHGEVPAGLKLEGKEIKGMSMKNKRTFSEDCEDVDFFGLPKLTEEKKPGKKLTEAESTYSNKEKPAKAPLVQKDPQTYNKTVDKLDASNKMKTKDEKPKVVGQDAIEKPKSEVGKEYGEKPGNPDQHNLGKPGDDSGDVMQGKGKSDSQQKELPSAKVKVGKPGDDSGKHMTDSKKRTGAMIRESARKRVMENAMLRRRMPGKTECAPGMKQNQELEKMGNSEKRKQMMQASAMEARKKMKKGSY